MHKTSRLFIVFTFALIISACAPQPSTAPREAAPPTKNVQSTNTEVVLPTETEIPGPTKTFAPIFNVGSVADFGLTDDYIGIDGRFEIVSMTEIEVTGLLFTVVEAPGVDIRLGIDRNFDDAFAVSLRDITGKTYNSRDFTLTIPSAAFDGRSFNSIAIYCYDTGDIFDFVLFDSP